MCSVELMKTQPMSRQGESEVSRCGQVSQSMAPLRMRIHTRQWPPWPPKVPRFVLAAFLVALGDGTAAVWQSGSLAKASDWGGAPKMVVGQMGQTDVSSLVGNVAVAKRILAAASLVCLLACGGGELVPAGRPAQRPLGEQSPVPSQQRNSTPVRVSPLA